MPRGPWGGSKWFEQILKVASAEFVAAIPVGGVCSSACMAFLCRDLGQQPLPSAVHHAYILKDFQTS
eukprot:10575830-Lingulodinium_polyedra.AAC.1